MFTCRPAGERAKAAAQGIFRRSFQTLRHCGVTARAFSEVCRRRHVLSFKHHAEVAALPEAEADELLDVAEAEGWSTRQLRTEAAAKGIFERAFQTLRNVGSVARAFETSRRRVVLSFKHHAEVAALPDRRSA